VILKILGWFGVFCCCRRPALGWVPVVWELSPGPGRSPWRWSCPESAPRLEAGQTAQGSDLECGRPCPGRIIVFWSDLPDNDGPDEKPSPEEITLTFDELVRVIRMKILISFYTTGIDNGAGAHILRGSAARPDRTSPADYACHDFRLRLKSVYVPHPRIHGGVGWKVAILSKYQIFQRTASAVDREGERDRGTVQDKPAILKAHFRCLMEASSWP